MRQKPGYISLTFDGVYKDTIKYAVPILNKYNIKATFYIVTGSINKTLEDKEIIDQKTIQQLHNQGHEIGSHSVSHGLIRTSFLQEIKQRWMYLKSIHSPRKILKKVRPSNIRRITTDIKEKQKSSQTIQTFIEEAQQSKRILEDIIQSEVTSFAYPGGKVNRQAIQELEKIYKNARGTSHNSNQLNSLQLHNLNSFFWTHKTDPATMNLDIEHKVNQGKWVIETFHAITETNGNKNDPYTISKETFAKHLKHITEKYPDHIQPIKVIHEYATTRKAKNSLDAKKDKSTAK